mmetsp:Transcript_30771/g.58405  ORF Transcript_30771/g.58405 Transcript_30771/m.58405 type:complete len:105 (+) Transcript_30771:1934-2248(+)
MFELVEVMFVIESETGIIDVVELESEERFGIIVLIVDVNIEVSLLLVLVLVLLPSVVIVALLLVVLKVSTNEGDEGILVGDTTGVDISAGAPVGERVGNSPFVG